MKISVVVPTFKRTHDLKRCLDALHSQNRKADEVIVVTQTLDTETRQFLETWQTVPNIKNVSTSEFGQVRALNAALKVVSGDIVAFTDDDAAPKAHWLERIEARFLENPKLGGLGGRDILVHFPEESWPLTQNYGSITWYGHIVGQHHRATGPLKEVCYLKGVNMAFRKSALQGLQFDTMLRGYAEYRNDFAISVEVAAQGWLLLFDPEIIVDHFSAKRVYNDHRGSSASIPIENNAFNEMWVFLKYLRGSLRFRTIVWMLFIGSKNTPGLMRIFSVKKMVPAMRGRWKALREWLKRK